VKAFLADNFWRLFNIPLRWWFAIAFIFFWVVGMMQPGCCSTSYGYESGYETVEAYYD
jgi:hypothetical protein